MKTHRIIAHYGRGQSEVIAWAHDWDMAMLLMFELRAMLPDVVVVLDRQFVPRDERKTVNQRGNRETLAIHVSV